MSEWDATGERAGAAVRDRVRAGTLPGWYGPSAGAVMALTLVFAQRFLEEDLAPLQMWLVLPVALIVALALRWAARRGRASSEAARRRRLLTVLAPALVAAAVVGGACSALGRGPDIATGAAAVALWLTLSAGFFLDNARAERQLRASA